jgi:Tfp pilus assembly protein PilN
MINLLPPKHMESIRYGRHNTVLRVWLIGAIVAIIGLVVILVAGWVYLDQQSKDFQKNISDTDQQLKAQNVDKVKAEAKEITGDIDVINKVLGQEVHFSDLIQSIGSYMPPGTVLGTLSLSNKVTGSIDLSANATDYKSAAQIAVNLSDPKDDLFSKVDIINISCGTDPQKAYRCSAAFRALFSKDAQTKYLGLASENKL